MEWYNPHCIIRPDAGGQWYIQDDATHSPYGINAIQQFSDRVQLFFTGGITNPPWQAYSKAGVVQITTDDGFAGSVCANANLGLGSITIYLRAHPNLGAASPPIDPAEVWSYLPPDRLAKMNGNLWVSATMKV